MAGAGAGAGANLSRLEARLRDLFNRVHLFLDMAKDNKNFVNPIVNNEAHRLLKRIDADCEDTYYLTVPPSPPPKPELSRNQRHFLYQYPSINHWLDNNPPTSQNSNPEPEHWMYNTWNLNEQIRREIAEANVPAPGFKRPRFRTRKARKGRKANKN
jgi:hypothetical protein